MISLVLFDINLVFDKITDQIKCLMAMKNSIIYKKSINKKVDPINHLEEWSLIHGIQN